LPDEASVLLDTLDGFQFEHLVADILRKLGYGRIEQFGYTQDEGRDIIISSAQGLIVVECKHQPNTSIGRPIVQKLHSAVISANTNRGILVTTGHFTEEAVEYAKNLAKTGTTIEMVDRPLLADLASRAGIRLVRHGEKLNVWSYDIPPREVTQRAVQDYVSSLAQTHPRNMEALLSKSARSVTFRPLYLVKYAVDATFATTVGVIHRESVANAKLILDGNNGQVYDDQIIQFFKNEQQTRFGEPPKELSGSLPTFKIDATSLQRMALSAITKLHTRTVPYYGANNRRYTKVCVPGVRDIHIGDIRQLYLPLIRFDFGLATTEYFVGGAQAPSGRFLPLSENLKNCRICGSPAGKNAIICDVCGKITHSGGILLSSVHGFQCKRCGRTTCRSDGYWRRRYVIWRELLCPACAEAKEDSETFQRIKPLSK